MTLKKMTQLNKVKFILFLLISINGCKAKEKEVAERDEFPNDGTGLPIPDFDKSFSQMLALIKDEYVSEDIEISRPYKFDSNNKPECWLKIVVVNPEVLQEGRYSFSVIAERIAKDVYSHLENPDKFGRIEICIRQEVGSVISVNSTMSKLFLRDSLEF